MSLADLLTLSRVVLSPVFFVFFFIDDFWGVSEWVSVVGAWLTFGLIELSDLFDGYVARRMKQVSDRGKLLDPFADSFSRLTYFFCFVLFGVMKPWIFLILLYRDLGVGFVRQLALRENFTMGARLSGKFKAWVYAITGIVGMLFFSLKKLLILNDKIVTIEGYVGYIFLVASAVAIWSLSDYILAYVKIKNNRNTLD